MPKFTKEEIEEALEQLVRDGLLRKEINEKGEVSYIDSRVPSEVPAIKE